MKKHNIFLLIILSFCFVLGQSKEPKPIILSLMEINNVDNDLKEKEIRQFKTRFEVKIQDKKPYLKLINRQYDQAIVESIRRSLKHKTTKDLFREGELQNEDIIVIMDLYRSKKGFASTNYKCDFRLLEVKTGVVFTLEAEESNITRLAEVVAEKVYKTLWTGVVTIMTNNRPYRLQVDDEVSRTIETMNNELVLLKGTHRIELEKTGYRPITDEFDIQPGETIIKSYNFVKRGAEVVVEGTPVKALIVLKSKRGGEYKGTLPYRNMLPEGLYTITIDHPGYFPLTDKFKVRDNKSIQKQVSLLPIKFSTVRNKSLLFPGLGQYYFGHKLKGLAYIAGEGLAITTAGVITFALWQKKIHRDNLVDRYWKGEVGLRTDIRSTERRMSFFEKIAIASYVGATAIYLYNIYDIYRYRPSFVKMPRQSSQDQYKNAFDDLDNDLKD